MTVAACVIYNPTAGRGRATRLLAEFRATAGYAVELWPAAKPGHAVELAREAAEQGFERVIAAGGDGTVHEVANGILQSGRRETVFSVWPCGSANDYAFTLGLIAWWKCRGERPPTETLVVDVGRIRGGGRERFYVNSLGIGFNGMVTVEARKIRRLRGLALYSYAFVRAMSRHFATPRMRIRFDDTVFDGPTLALTLNLAQREGGFPITPAASLTDGRLDYVHAARLTRGHLLRYLPAMATGRLRGNPPLLRLGRAERVGVVADAPLCIHADGEFFSVPADRLSECVVEVVSRRLRVEVFSPAFCGGRS